ncbi:MAG TPA: hypothetical protein VLT60_01090 [Usitatibacter sp.]|nr:hypothetical protein [Usitatibacter sp.]
MASFFISTFVFFVVGYLVKRKLEEWDIPGGMTRATVIFVIAAIAAYGVGFVVDLIAR